MTDHPASLQMLMRCVHVAQAVTSMLRNPERLAELAPSLDPQLVPRLCADVLVARACDSIYSPEADAARLAVGVPLRGCEWIWIMASQAGRIRSTSSQSTSSQLRVQYNSDQLACHRLRI